MYKHLFKTLKCLGPSYRQVPDKINITLTRHRFYCFVLRQLFFLWKLGLMELSRLVCVCVCVCVSH